VGSLGDMGYVVNPFAADAFKVPAGGAAGDLAPSGAEGWEKPLPVPGVLLSPIPGVAPMVIKRP
jgi:hypothetical protein